MTETKRIHTIALMLIACVMALMCAVIAPSTAHADTVVQDGWVVSEATGGYQYYSNGRAVTNKWVVTNIHPGETTATLHERYWIDANGQLATSRLISEDEAGWYAYARPDGSVVRGSYRDVLTGYVYLADNDGKLANPGWIVSDQYGQGLQRYFVDARTHACVPGKSDEGWPHVTTPQGYVLRGLLEYDGEKYLANNDGLLATSTWLVTGEFTNGNLERYWIDDTGKVAANRLLYEDECGWYAFAKENGAVVRGCYQEPSSGVLFIANNDGKLADAGWVVSDQYGHGLQRYYVDPAAHGCVPGYSTDGWPHITTENGYVLRGAYTDDNGRYFADNDGRVAVNDWVKTSAFSGTEELYWANEDGIIVSSTLVEGEEDGETFYAFAKESGAIATGRYTDPSTGYVYLAQANGHLENAGWVVSSAYGQGMQRYYVDTKTHACVPGYSTDGWPHYTLPEGYVARNNAITDYGMLLVNNDGVVVSQGWVEKYSGSGYYVQTDIVAGWNVISLNQSPFVLDRYYFEEHDGFIFARVGYFQAMMDGQQQWFYADQADAHVLRGKNSVEDGVIIADNEGRLVENNRSAGWYVGTDYDSAIQRYYFVENADGHLVAKTGLFEAKLNGETQKFYGEDQQGYVLRNATVVYDGWMYEADNDGVLTPIAESGPDNGRDSSLSNVTWATNQPYLQKCRDLAAQYWDPQGGDSNWFVVSDWELCRCVVLENVDGNWVIRRCINTNNDRSNRWGPGIYHITDKQICNWADEYFDQDITRWASCFVEAYSDYDDGHSRYFETGPHAGKYEDCAAFHGLPEGSDDTGHDMSGCIGMRNVDSKWIWDNVPLQTPVWIF